MNDAPVATISGVSGNVTAIADELENGLSYKWRARAVDRSGGKSEFAPAQTFIVQVAIQDPDVSVSGGGCQASSRSSLGNLAFLGLALGLVGLLRRRRKR